MKPYIYTIFAVICFIFIPITLIGSVIITLSMEVKYKAISTVDFKDNYNLNITKQIVTNEYLIEKVANNNELIKYINTFTDKSLSQKRLYTFLKKSINYSFAKDKLIISCCAKTPYLSNRIVSQIAKEFIIYYKNILGNTNTTMFVSTRQYNKPCSPNRALNLSIAVLVSIVFFVTGILLIKLQQHRNNSSCLEEKISS